MATFQPFNCTAEDLGNGKHNLGEDDLRFLLSNVAPSATAKKKADITEIAPGNGYIEGGKQVGITSSSQTGGIYSLVPSADVDFTATDNSMAPFRFVIWLNNTSDCLLGYYDRGNEVTLNKDEVFKVDVQANLLTIRMG